MGLFACIYILYVIYFPIIVRLTKHDSSSDVKYVKLYIIIMQYSNLILCYTSDQFSFLTNRNITEK